MPRTDRLIKSIVTTCVPAILFALLAFQIHRHKWVLILRNHYLVETISPGSAWVWNALSGDIQLHPDEIPQHNGEDFPAELQQAPFSPHKDKTAKADVLAPGLPSLTVHYVWCVDGHFELSHYLSVRSVLHQLQPDRIVIHYRILPRTDPKGYWRWLEDLQRDVVMFSLQPLKDSQVCSHTLSSGISSDSQDFPDPRGVFILGNVAVYNLTRSSLMKTIRESYTDSLSKIQSQSEGIKPREKAQVFLVGGSEPYHVKQAPGHIVVTCRPMADFNLDQSKETQCIDMNSYFTPEDVYGRNSRFFRYSRNLLFQNPEPVEARLSTEIQIPNSLHIVLKGNGEITPLLYTSIKSAYVMGKMDQVFLHSPQPPTGALWERLQKKDELKPQFVPTAAFEKYATKQGAMVYALYNILLHGGVTHFGDVIFIKPLPQSALKAPAIATRHFSQYRMKHRSLNTAILAAAKGSEFVESLLAMVKQAIFSWPDATVDDIATHVEETNPSQVLLDGSLTSHQNCASNLCRVAGGHAYPKETYTTRLMWSSKSPSSVEELKAFEGPSRSLIAEIIDGPSHSP